MIHFLKEFQIHYFPKLSYFSGSSVQTCSYHTSLFFLQRLLPDPSFMLLRYIKHRCFLFKLFLRSPFLFIAPKINLLKLIAFKSSTLYYNFLSLLAIIAFHCLISRTNRLQGPFIRYIQGALPLQYPIILFPTEV